MSVDKNLFLYDVAIVSIMKNEGPYIKEWLDYHLLAGADHFYIYDNGSPDNQKEVLKPYIDAGIVTYIFYPGQARQYEAYSDAVKNYRFFCKHMAFIDGDEFIFPQNNKNIVEVLDEILQDKSKAGGVAVNWHQFGSNFQEKADLNRGVLDRFTRRASDENIAINPKNNLPSGNAHIKTIGNPRKIDFFQNPHYAIFFDYSFPVNEKGEQVKFFFNNPPTVEKIVLNHYPMKSREEYEKKVSRGAADSFVNIYVKHPFENYYNDEADEEIIKYRDAKINALKSAGNENLFDIAAAKLKLKYENLGNALLKNLLPVLSENVPPEFFDDKMETFLTCFAISKKLNIAYRNEPLALYSLLAVHKQLLKKNDLADYLLFLNALPDILEYTGSLVDEIRKTCSELIPFLIEYIRIRYNNFNRYYYWSKISELQFLQKMLKSFDANIKR